MTTVGQPRVTGARTVGRMLRPTAKALPEHARAHNRSMVLAHLFHEGVRPRGRTSPAARGSLVSRSPAWSGDLMAEGLVTELGVRSEGKVGKPATLVGMQTEAFQIVAVDLTDDSRLLGAVMTLLGDVLHRLTVPLDGATGDAAVELLETLCRDLLALG